MCYWEMETARFQSQLTYLTGALPESVAIGDFERGTDDPTSAVGNAFRREYQPLAGKWRRHI